MAPKICRSALLAEDSRSLTEFTHIIAQMTDRTAEDKHHEGKEGIRLLGHDLGQLRKLPNDIDD